MKARSYKFVRTITAQPLLLIYIVSLLIIVLVIKNILINPINLFDIQLDETSQPTQTEKLIPQTTPTQSENKQTTDTSEHQRITQSANVLAPSTSNLIRETNWLHIGDSVLDLITLEPNQKKFCNVNSSLIFLVVSECKDQRQVIRKTWGNVNNDTDLQVLFLISRNNNRTKSNDSKKITNRINKEHQKYNDVIVLDYDQVQNDQAAVSTLIGLNWIVRSCSPLKYLKFVIKTDEMMFINVYRMLELIDDAEIDIIELADQFPKNGIQKSIICPVEATTEPNRQTSSKNYISKSEYPQSRFPYHCKPTFYMLSRDLIPLVLSYASTTRFVKLDHVFITGFIPLRLTGVSYVDWSDYVDPFDGYCTMYKNPRLNPTFCRTSEIKTKLKLHRQYEELNQMKPFQRRSSGLVYVTVDDHFYYPAKDPVLLALRKNTSAEEDG